MTARLADQIGVVLAAHRTPAAVIRAPRGGLVTAADAANSESPRES